MYTAPYPGATILKFTMDSESSPLVLRSAENVEEAKALWWPLMKELGWVHPLLTNNRAQFLTRPEEPGRGRRRKPLRSCRAWQKLAPSHSRRYRYASRNGYPVHLPKQDGLGRFFHYERNFPRSRAWPQIVDRDGTVVQDSGNHNDWA